VSARPTRDRLRSEELALLRLLAGAGADRDPVIFSSRELGEALGVSQQAADRYLMAMAQATYLTRTLGGRKQRLQLTPAGVEVLRREYHGYRRIFEGPGQLRVTGVVTSGLGEGRYYLSQPGYIVQFQERLGYTPFPGTLNVRVAPKELLRIDVVRHWRGTRIDGFQASGRTFGGATCYAARLNGRSSQLIRPDRTHYQDVVEFIAPESLREALGLRDEDPVTMELMES
jgi:riboflavin kinase